MRRYLQFIKYDRKFSQKVFGQHFFLNLIYESQETIAVAHQLDVILDVTLAKPFIPKSKMEKIEQLKLSPKQLQSAEKLHYSWYLSATNALLGAVAREIYLRMNK